MTARLSFRPLADARPRNDGSGAVLDGLAQRRLCRRRGLRREMTILGMPFRTRPAHIVKVGPVGISAFAQAPLQPTHRFRKVTPHSSLPCPCFLGPSWDIASPDA